MNKNLMDGIMKAKELRRQMVALSATMDDAQGVEYPDFFPQWKEGRHYTVGQRIGFNGVLYRCIEEHDSREDWSPTDAKTLFEEVTIGNDALPDEWKQPSATKPYMLGDKVFCDGFIWESMINDNLWRPNIQGSETRWSKVND